MSTVFVHCREPNGVELHVDELIEGQLGIKTARRKGEPLILRQGRNEIDAEFWAAWAEQNKDGEFLKSHTIEAEKTEEKVQEKPDHDRSGPREPEPAGGVDTGQERRHDGPENQNIAGSGR